VFAPARLVYSLRPRSALGGVAAAAVVALMFAATPFLIPEVADRYGVTDGLAGGISVVQVAFFALANFAAPRTLAANGRLLRGSVLALATVNAASALPSLFPVLLVLRAVAGTAAGIITWIVWSDAMRRASQMGRIAAAAPVTALLATPVLSLIGDSGDQLLYLALAAGTLPAALLPCRIDAPRDEQRRVSASRSNRVLLAALFLLTFAGAALFVFAAVAARDVLRMSPTVASFAFSLNAGGGLLGARLASRHRRPGWWLASTGPAAFLTIAGGTPVLFFFAMAWWGFAFWMGVPGVLQMLSARSLEPAERAGDAQAMMAVGRAAAPVLGGAFVDAGAYTALAATAGIGLVMSGAIVVAVQEGRERLPVRTAG
jgi:predicted MFS family arabinose efflux permease